MEKAIDEYVEEKVDKGEGGKFEANTESNEESGKLPTLPPDITIDDMSLAELEDLKTIAEEEDISFFEAIKGNGSQDEFLDYADKMEESYPDRFAGAAMDDENNGVWVGFKGDIPDEAVKEADSLPFKVKLKANKGYSEDELKSEMKSTQEEAYNHNIEDANGFYDIQTGEINIEAEPKASLAQNKKEDSLKELEDSQPENSNMELDVEFVDHLDNADEDKYIRGGGDLGTCSAGFTVHDGNEKGISTAGHCAKDNPTRTYSNEAGDGGSTTVTRQDRQQGNDGDLAYYDTGDKTATRTFYYDSGEKRYATDIQSPREGINVCNYGNVTGNKCTTVDQVGVSSGTYDGLTLVKSHVTDNGDSGSPWFYSGNAIGIHNGEVSGKSSFTPADNLRTAVGMTVYTK